MVERMVVNSSSAWPEQRLELEVGCLLVHLDGCVWVGGRCLYI